jgi:hypothetical protein
MDYWGAIVNTKEQRLGRPRARQIERMQRLSQEPEVLVSMILLVCRI